MSHKPPSRANGATNSRATTAPKGRATASQRQRASAARAAAARQKRRNQWIGAAAAVLLIVGIVAMAGLTGPDATGTTTKSSFDLPSLRGSERVALASFAGKPTVVNMFASWCDQCEAELPGFHDAAAKLKGEVNFVFVNSNETGDGTEMAERFDLFDFPVASDVDGTAGNGLYRSLGGTSGMPLTAFYDADGNVVDVAFGSLVGSSLDQALEKNFGITA